MSPKKQLSTKISRVRSQLLTVAVNVSDFSIWFALSLSQLVLIYSRQTVLCIWQICEWTFSCDFPDSAHYLPVAALAAVAQVVKRPEMPQKRPNWTDVSFIPSHGIWIREKSKQTKARAWRHQRKYSCQISPWLIKTAAIIWLLLFGSNFSKPKVRDKT